MIDGFQHCHLTQTMQHVATWYDRLVRSPFVGRSHLLKGGDCLKEGGEEDDAWFDFNGRLIKMMSMTRGLPG